MDTVRERGSGSVVGGNSGVQQQCTGLSFFSASLNILLSITYYVVFRACQMCISYMLQIHSHRWSRTWVGNGCKRGSTRRMSTREKRTEEYERMTRGYEMHSLLGDRSEEIAAIFTIEEEECDEDNNDSGYKSSNVVSTTPPPSFPPTRESGCCITTTVATSTDTALMPVSATTTTGHGNDDNLRRVPSSPDDQVGGRDDSSSRTSSSSSSATAREARVAGYDHDDHDDDDYELDGEHEDDNRRKQLAAVDVGGHDDYDDDAQHGGYGPIVAPPTGQSANVNKHGRHHRGHGNSGTVNKSLPQQELHHRNHASWPRAARIWSNVYGLGIGSFCLVYTLQLESFYGGGVACATLFVISVREYLQDYASRARMQNPSTSFYHLTQNSMRTDPANYVLFPMLLFIAYPLLLVCYTGWWWWSISSFFASFQELGHGIMAALWLFTSTLAAIMGPVLLTCVKRPRSLLVTMEKSSPVAALISACTIIAFISSPQGWFIIVYNI